MFRFGGNLGDSLFIVCVNESSAILSWSNLDREQLTLMRAPKFNFVYHAYDSGPCSRNWAAGVRLRGRVTC